MCGFVAGIFSKETAPDDAAVGRALDAIAHRGPDGRDVVRIDLGDRVAVMGHVRLAMVGLSDGRQPFVTPGTALVVNGEFYDHAAARRRFEAAGRRFATSSDSEIALHAWESSDSDDDAWLASLRGEWALALLDRRRGTMTAACDQHGVRPLRYWASRDGRSFAMASEAKALFALGAPRELDPRRSASPWSSSTSRSGARPSAASGCCPRAAGSTTTATASAYAPGTTPSRSAPSPATASASTCRPARPRPSTPRCAPARAATARPPCRRCCAGPWRAACRRRSRSRRTCPAASTAPPSPPCSATSPAGPASTPSAPRSRGARTRSSPPPSPPATSAPGCTRSRCRRPRSWRRWTRPPSTRRRPPSTRTPGPR